MPFRSILADLTLATVTDMTLSPGAAPRGREVMELVTKLPKPRRNRPSCGVTGLDRARDTLRGIQDAQSCPSGVSACHVGVDRFCTTRVGRGATSPKQGHDQLGQYRRLGSPSWLPFWSLPTSSLRSLPSSRLCYWRTRLRL